MGFFRHYKGGIYEVITIGEHTETGENMVVYKDENRQIWVRPSEMFNEIIVSSDGVETERFKYIGESNPIKE